MKFRVVQWGTGAVGAWSLRQIIDHPDLELVGVWVSGQSKAGKDAGDLCGRPVTGVRATSSKEAIFSLDADVVIHCALAVGADGALPFDEDVAMLLRSGKNVISTASYYSPTIEGSARMNMLQAACQAGSATLYGGGVDPGFACDRVAALLTGSVAEIRQIRMTESQDVSTHPGVALLSEVGFGKRPEERKLDSPGVMYYGGRLLPAAVAKLADLLGVRLEGIQHREDLVLATKDVETAMGILKTGTIIGTRAEFSGIRDGKPFITHQWVTYMGRDGIPPDWLMAPIQGGTAPPYLVRIEIDGRPSLQNDMIYTDHGDVTSFSFPTAAVCINAVPDVCAAPPGLLQEQVFGRWRASMCA